MRVRMAAGAIGREEDDMSELWQGYGTWIIYAVIVLGMLWMHGGFGRRGGHGGAHGHAQGHSGAHGHDEGDSAAHAEAPDHAESDPHDRRAVAASSAGPAAEVEGKGSRHSHGRGCC